VSDRTQLVTLDSDRIRAAMNAHGVSHRDLAEALGKSLPRVTALVQGRSHGSLTLTMLSRLCNALDLELDDVLRRSATKAGPTAQSEPAAQDDARALGALLLDADGPLRPGEAAAALGWSIARVTGAAAELATRAVTVGAILKQTAAGYRLAPAETAVSAAARNAAQHARSLRRDLAVPHAQILAAVAAGESMDDTAAGVRRDSGGRLIGGGRPAAALGKLLRDGYIERAGSSYRLTEQAAYSLGLSNRPPLRIRGPVTTDG
jgi:transcriptional regulator with XRE-family HTH domain